MVAREFPSSSQAQYPPSFSQASNCFVTFVYGGGLPPFVLEVRPGRRASRPPSWERKGYRFDGWFTDAACEDEWDFGRAVGGDNFTLHAKWFALPYFITYYLNGGVNDPLNPDTYTVEDPDIVLQSPTRNGDEFVGWYEDVEFLYAPTGVIHTHEARNVTLYARFLAERKVVVAAQEALVDRYEGDPKLYLTPDGADLHYVAGQPDMEVGLDNQAYISLFTREGWVGNVFLPAENRVGSDFEKTCSGSITKSKLADIEDSAVRALQSRAFPQVSATVRNPRADSLFVEATVKGGGVLSLSREGILWQNQRAKGSPWVDLSRKG